MKLNHVEVKKLGARLEAKRRHLGLGYAEISRKAGVNQGQVSRICRGKFKTHSANVMQICMILEVNLIDDIADEKASNKSRRLSKIIMDLWDGTPDDADRLVRLLAAVADIRRNSK